MKKSATPYKTLRLWLSTLFLVLSLCFLFTSCGEETLHTKEEITLSMTSEEDLDENYVSTYLDRWGVPNFGAMKMRGVEVVYRDHYVEDLPAAIDLAKSTTTLFLENFYDKINLEDEVAVTDALINCYISSLDDKYSTYRTGTEYNDYTTDMSGTFYGIGATVQHDQIEGTLTIVSVNIGSGAYDAGLLAGDLLISADGFTLEEVGYSGFISKVRGELGTRVKITVDRGGEILEFDVERKKVVEESCTYSINEEKIAYITITDFKANTAAQFKEAIDKAESDGAVGIIYDLRSNPGGYLSAVVEMLSYIAPSGMELVSFSNDYASPMKSKGSHTLTLPTVVLCNEYTASGGELFTAAIRDFRDMEMFDAKLVGVTTFGKGIMQNTYEFTDGTAVTMTVAYYNPPSGVNYHKIGVTPDVEVRAEEGDVDIQLSRAYEERNKLINK